MHKLTIAGPGAGKTTRMVESIIEDLPNLTPYRFMAAITYTNAATDNIISKLNGRVKMPNNLFVGTIHSFLIRFILHPYGYLCNMTPQNKKYIDQVFGYMKTEEQKNQIRTKADELVEKGLITYDKVLELSYKIISENDQIANVVGYRLQFLFVDEYQDSRLYQHNIIERLMRDDNKIELIGDPCQSIYGFQYEQSQLRDEPSPASFQETPIIKSQEEGNFAVEHSPLNYRSTDNIVKLLNSMNGGLQDYRSNHPEENHPIYYLSSTKPDEILSRFNELLVTHQLQKEVGVYHKMILGRTWGLLRKFNDQTTIIEINNKQEIFRSSFNEFMRIIIAVLGTSSLRIVKEHKISRIRFRKFVLECLFEIRNLNRNEEPLLSLFRYYKEEPIHRLIINKWNAQFPMANKKYEDTADVKIGVSLLGCLNHSGLQLDEQKNAFVYSTIHGAKGLEASSVLVIAESKTWGEKISANEYIKSWLNNEKKGDDDEPRCGFVAFSRARKLLVIASLEELSDENKLTVENLGIEII